MRSCIESVITNPPELLSTEAVTGPDSRPVTVNYRVMSRPVVRPAEVPVASQSVPTWSARLTTLSTLSALSTLSTIWRNDLGSAGARQSYLKVVNRNPALAAKIPWRRRPARDHVVLP